MLWRISPITSGRVAPLALAYKELAFWQVTGLTAGCAFMASGVLFFFAYNWDMMHHLVKLGILLAATCASLGAGLHYGADSLQGKSANLFAAIVVGVLFATFGQVYQTGADAVDLFKTWVLFLLPLAVAARHSGVWFLTWFVGTLWGILYLGRHIGSPLEIFFQMGKQTPLVFLIAQIAFLAVWEGLSARFHANPGFAWLNARWVPRSIAFLLCQLFISNFIVLYFGLGGHYSFDYVATAKNALPHYMLFTAWLGGLWLWYRYKQPDIVMLCTGSYTLFTLCTVILIDFVVRVSDGNEGSFIASSLLSALVLCGLMLALTRYLRHVYKTFTTDHGRETTHSSTWAMHLLLGICAWITSLFMALALGGLFFLLGIHNSVPFFLLLCGLLALGLSWMLLHSEALFFRLMGLPSCLIGTVSLIAAIVMHVDFGPHNSTLPFLLSAAVVFAVGYTFPGRGLRFVAAAAGNFLLLYAVQTPGFLFSLLHLSGLPRDIGYWLGMTLVLFWNLAWVYAMLQFFRLAWFSPVENGRRRTFFQEPSVSLGLFAGVALYTLLIFVITNPRFNLMWLLSPSMGAGCMGLAMGLGVIGLKRISTPDRTPYLHTIALFFLTPALYAMPGLGIGLMGLALGQAIALRSLVGLSALFTAVYISYYYYSLHSTLLAKSFSLALAGLVCLLVAYVLGFLAQRFEKEMGISSGAGQADVPTSKSLRTVSLTLTTLVLLALCVAFPFQVFHKERQLTSGQDIFLALAPVDPRSLMQGDYMVLDYALDMPISQAVEQLEDPKSWQGYVVIEADADNIAHFVRLHPGPAKTFKSENPAEKLLLVRRHKENYQRDYVLARSFFFQEGNEPLFAKARYAQFRLAPDGTAMLHRLADQNKRVIQADKEPAQAEQGQPTTQ